MSFDINESIAANLASIRDKAPLVHNICNFVSMDFVANALLASGASPIMAHAEEELEDIIGISSSSVLNIGTLDRAWLSSIFKAVDSAHAQGKPVVLDPVGAGATALRSRSSLELVSKPGLTVLRANASELLALAENKGGTKGADTSHSVDEIEETIKRFAFESGIVIAITGPYDFVTDGRASFIVEGGHFLMPRITGTGCVASALVGAFLGVEDNPLMASVSALAYFALAGKKAGEKANGPASFRLSLLDNMYKLSPEELYSLASVRAV